MSEKKFEVYDLKVNQITEALGMDVEKPVFSWKLRAEKQNTMQKQAQILVGKTDGSAGVWDSGVMDTDESAGIAYAGEALEAETRYYVTVKVWDQDGEEAETSSWFETGLMNGSISAWDGAKCLYWKVHSASKKAQKQVLFLEQMMHVLWISARTNCRLRERTIFVLF